MQNSEAHTNISQTEREQLFTSSYTVFHDISFGASFGLSVLSLLNEALPTYADRK